MSSLLMHIWQTYIQTVKRWMVFPRKDCFGGFPASEFSIFKLFTGRIVIIKFQLNIRCEVPAYYRERGEI